jgi:hypothetical protein
LTVQNNSKSYKIKEKETRKGLRLILTIGNIDSVKILHQTLEVMLKSE